MLFKFKNTKVRINMVKRYNSLDLLVLDETGKNIINKYERCVVDGISSNGIFISGFEKTNSSKYIFREMFFIQNF
jgi:hypothetical protein